MANSDDERKRAEELMKKAQAMPPQGRPQQPAPMTEKEREELKKQIDQLKAKLETFKKEALKKFPYITSISLIPPEASDLFEEEAMKKEAEKEKFMHLYIVLPDEKEKEYSKFKLWAIKAVQDIKPRIWLHVVLTRDLWEICYDGKNEMVDAIAASMPVHDKGLLGSLKVANWHKIMCLRKFENYIVSYVMAGSIIRGNATKTSDVDVYVIVDDTDVKRITRAELKSKLRGIIEGYAFEAGEITGIKNKLSPQVYLLTDFWDGIREANPIFFTFVRDGVPIYDRGTFMPWKLLLKMGKITGTPEAIEKFMAAGEDISKIIKRKLLDIATGEIYWSIITPSQGALMLYGLAPTTPKETVSAMKEVFYDKEKLLEKKYLDFLERVVGLYKGYEHGKVKEVSGTEIDELMKGSEEYLARIKKLVEEVGKRIDEKTMKRIYDDILSILKTIFGNLSEKQLIDKFESELIKKGKIPESMSEVMKDVMKANKKYEKKAEKLDKADFERTRKDALQLIGVLTEYTQRGKLAELEKTRFFVTVGDKEGELYLFDKKVFLIEDIKQPEILVIDTEKGTSGKATPDDLAEAQRKPAKVKLSSAMLAKIEKIIGKKIEILF